MPPPPPVVEGNTLEPSPDNPDILIEYDENGVPLGEWTYEDPPGIWIFDEFPPLGGVPGTGDEGVPIYLFILLGAGLIGAGVIAGAMTKKRRNSK